MIWMNRTCNCNATNLLPRSRLQIVAQLAISVPSTNWISCGNNRATSLKRSNNSCLWYTNTLLFHGFMDTHPGNKNTYQRHFLKKDELSLVAFLSPVLVIHFVKLIDKTDSSVRKYKCPSFKRPLPCHWILVYCCSQTNSRSSLSSRVDGSLTSFLDVSREKKKVAVMEYSLHEVHLPEMYTYFRNCDFAVPGSPSRSTLMSPRNLCFPLMFFSWPPNIARAIAVLISSCPYIDGAIDLMIWETNWNNFKWDELNFEGIPRIYIQLTRSTIRGSLDNSSICVLSSWVSLYAEKRSCFFVT